MLSFSFTHNDASKKTGPGLFALMCLFSFADVSLAEENLAKPVVLNDNGAWCWYQDERAIYDAENNALLVGSVAGPEGTNGKERGGDVDLVTYHFADKKIDRLVLHPALKNVDDHNAAALLIRPDGKYLAMYSQHNQANVSYYRVSKQPHDATAWEPEQTFDWTEHLAKVDPECHVTYSNLFYLQSEKRIYDFTRAVNTDPTCLTSADQGATWQFRGRIATMPRKGYVNAYAKYASNNVDRIDFLITEHHPRDFNNSVYHGYYQAGKLHRSTGEVVKEQPFSEPPPANTDFTPVFVADSQLGGAKLTHGWIMDVHLDAQNHPYCLLSARANDEPENSNYSDHRFLYAHFDGQKWQVHHLCKAGNRLWDHEQDYTGLATIDPQHLDTVYASTTIDPQNGKSLRKHEIFKGVTSDGGATWQWTPITANSTVDNLRPLAAIHPLKETVLLWFRGTMSRSQHFDCEVVGILP